MTFPRERQLRQLHHCHSQGTPSPSPSIPVFPQFCMKYLASAQEVIWEQYLRPSQLNRGAESGSDFNWNGDGSTSV